MQCSLPPSAGEGNASSSNKLLVESAHPSITARAALHPALLSQATLKPVVTIIPSTSHQHFQRWDTPWLGVLHVIWILKELGSVFQLAPAVIVSAETQLAEFAGPGSSAQPPHHELIH